MAGTGTLEGSTACRRPAGPLKSRPVWISDVDTVQTNSISFSREVNSHWTYEGTFSTAQSLLSSDSVRKVDPSEV
jgi:hypothetical protein